MHLRKWLGRTLWTWSIRVYPEWYEHTVVDGQGVEAASVGFYGQGCAVWQKPYDVHITNPRIG